MVKSVSSRRLGVGAPLGRSLHEASAAPRPVRPATLRASGASVIPSHVGTGSGNAVPRLGSGSSSAPRGEPILDLSEASSTTGPPAVTGSVPAGFIFVDGIRFRVPQARQSAASASSTSGCSRGSLAAAAATAASDESMATAISDLLRDQFATSSLAARNSQLRTWHSMHRMAYCRESAPPPAFPLTEDKILRIAALFKAAG